MGKLENKIAVITGGNSGIGLATARRYKAEGATVVINARNAQRLAETKAELGDEFDILQADVRSVAELEAFYNAIGEKYGRIDVLFLNAGVASAAPLEYVDENLYSRILDTNVKGVFFGVQKALPLLQKGSSVIVTTSIANNKGMAGMNIYSASKAAVRSLAENFAAELAEKGIRVNALSPGPVETPIFGKMGMTEEQMNGFAGGVLGMVPMKRFGSPDELAGPALFLASDDSSYMTGTELVIDGGFAFV